jgi:DNA replication regulator DPB11
MEIKNLLVHQNGTYADRNEGKPKLTHLLCSGDEDTEKRQYAEKFNKLGEGKIHMVWEEWFWDSLEFGGGHLSCHPDL